MGPIHNCGQRQIHVYEGLTQHRTGGERVGPLSNNHCCRRNVKKIQNIVKYTAQAIVGYLMLLRYLSIILETQSRTDKTAPVALRTTS